ncbi:MAG: hypothetical protein ABIQ18_25270 [Umezawaea sp.]
MTDPTAESLRLIAVLGNLSYDGFSLACTADIDAAEAARRLEADVVADDEIRTYGEGPPASESIRTMGATTVPGGCVLFQPWAYGAAMPGVLSTLSVNTTSYGLYANPKSGNQGTVIVDGVVVGWDLHPGGGEDDEESPLLDRLYEFHAVAHCFAYVDLAPKDDRSITGPPDMWLRLPDYDYWTV